MSPEEPEDRDADNVFRFRKKSLQVSLSFEREDIGIAPDYEGETSSVSRLGMGARVDPVGQSPMDPQELEDEILFVWFHVPWADTIQPRATVEMVGESEDHRYRLYLGLTFHEEINLTRLISG
jgi:hypothetical protein